MSEFHRLDSEIVNGGIAKSFGIFPKPRRRQGSAASSVPQPAFDVTIRNKLIFIMECRKNYLPIVSASQDLPALIPTLEVFAAHTDTPVFAI